MSDIISEISRISEDELRMQIALIDNVNISNAVKETGYRLVNVLADVANSLTSLYIANRLLFGQGRVEPKGIVGLSRSGQHHQINPCLFKGGSASVVFIQFGIQ